jgi:hypothetical protein
MKLRIPVSFCAPPVPPIATLVVGIIKSCLAQRERNSSVIIQIETTSMEETSTCTTLSEESMFKTTPASRAWTFDGMARIGAVAFMCLGMFVVSINQAKIVTACSTEMYLLLYSMREY